MNHAKKVFLFALFVATSLFAADNTSPVTYQHIVRHDPNLSIHVVTIDLTDPLVSLHVCRAGDPPAPPTRWLTSLLPPSEIAQRDHDDIAINGDFFDAEKTQDIEGKNSGYVKGKAAAPVGPAMSDGKLWCRHATTRPVIEIDKHDYVLFTTFNPNHLSKSITQIIGGYPIILKDGQVPALKSRFATARHPRTAVGLNKSGTKLFLLVVDGRQPDISIGMTLPELAQQMLDLGCYNAINLDGGGSSVLVMRDPATHQLRIMNSPSDTRERAVADAVCVKVDAPMPALP